MLQYYYVKIYSLQTNTGIWNPKMFKARCFKQVNSVHAGKKRKVYKFWVRMCSKYSSGGDLVTKSCPTLGIP